jgi:hypothetical protein
LRDLKEFYCSSEDPKFLINQSFYEFFGTGEHLNSLSIVLGIDCICGLVYA